MNRLLTAIVALLAGVLAVAIVGVGVTVALDPYVWPSALLGLPAGLLAGLGTTVVAYFGLRYRGDRTAATAARFRTAVATVGTFAVAATLASVAASFFNVGVASAMLTVGLPVGLLAAAVAGLLVSRRTRRQPGGGLVS